MSKRATKPKTTGAAEQTSLQPLVGQRQKSESDPAVVACNDWLRLGSGRTLSTLAQRYRDLPQSTAPTTSINTLQAWSKTFGWAERAAEYDASWESRKNAERQSVLDYGLALDFERIEKLKRLADFLEGQIYERGATDDGKPGPFHNVWTPDVKSIGTGEYAERVDIERFNGALLSEYRATLDDIAKEVGGRVKKQEVTGKDGGAIHVQFSADKLAKLNKQADDELKDWKPDAGG